MKHSQMCIYGIFNTENQKCYIGSTVQFKGRKNKHLLSLKKCKHHSYLLQEDWNEKIFEFRILEEIKNKDSLLEREQWWIDNTNSYYNICKKSNSVLGIKHLEHVNKLKSIRQSGGNHWTTKKNFSEESKKKMSDSQKKLYKNGYISPIKGKKRYSEYLLKMSKSKSKPILQYDLLGNLIKEYPSICSVKNDGYLPEYVINCCKKTRNKYRNSIWEYKNNKL
ncbi:GIY-YIG nuclease family protein [Epilithonimonas sp.]|uniref:GIY-YIG nuclease family protein n=1 Tax=Epilithonimonas sp. TaxID=2894511 RepID=UPI0035B191B3